MGHCVLSSDCDAVLVQAGCFDAGVGQSSSDEGPGMGEQNERQQLWIGRVYFTHYSII